MCSAGPASLEPERLDLALGRDRDVDVFAEIRFLALLLGLLDVLERDLVDQSRSTGQVVGMSVNAHYWGTEHYSATRMQQQLAANPAGGFALAETGIETFVFTPADGPPLLFQSVLPTPDATLPGRGTDELTG